MKFIKKFFRKPGGSRITVEENKIYVENFFDYSAGEKKKVIKMATEGANKKQKAMIVGYNFAFYKKPQQ